MIPFALAALLAPALMASAAQAGGDQPAPAAPPASSAAAGAPQVGGAVLAGGYSRMSRFAPELRVPVQKAVAAITPLRKPGARLVSAEQQVVAGANYRLTIKLRDGSRWRAVVWRRLDGSHAVIEAVRIDR